MYPLENTHTILYSESTEKAEVRPLASGISALDGLRWMGERENALATFDG